MCVKSSEKIENPSAGGNGKRLNKAKNKLIVVVSIKIFATAEFIKNCPFKI